MMIMMTRVRLNCLFFSLKWVTKVGSSTIYLYVDIDDDIHISCLSEQGELKKEMNLGFSLLIIRVCPIEPSINEN